MNSEIKNVVLIVVDALRTDRVGVYSGDDLTPNIDSLANDGEVFDHSFSCVNATDSSVTTILTGLYPTRHGVINHGEGVTEEEQQFAAGTTPLPELIDSSYEAVGIDTLERWHQRGFETYINPRREQSSSLIQYVGTIVEQLPSSIEAFIKDIYSRSTADDVQPTQSEAITDNALHTIGNTTSPFFLFAHYWDTHIPYIPIEDHSEKIRERKYDERDEPLEKSIKPIEGSPWANRLEENLTGDSETVLDLKRKYDAGVWQADQAVGRIVDELKQGGIYDETAIIVTADHGESFTEHGILFDHHGLYDPTIHVPLIIKAPGFEGREDQFVQHFDLAPTILDLLGVEYQKERFDGVSLVTEGPRTLDRDAVFTEEGHTARKRTIRTQSYKYIKRLDDRSECRYCEIRHAADEELYDLENDPEEEHNIVDEEPEVKARLDARLNSWIEQLPEPSKEETIFDTSQEVKDHLEEMGYL
ncbi:sulfatase family protein [Halobellus ordinarius]|uniref:sulfatase family protein n=1 Tax=Halobellus ordinarius TaxID=3075120 RepID=UPI0028808A84|nr:sulfatase [Halobellus sp. ZY16]